MLTYATTTPPLVEKISLVGCTTYSKEQRVEEGRDSVHPTTSSTIFMADYAFSYHESVVYYSFGFGALTVLARNPIVDHVYQLDALLVVHTMVRRMVYVAIFTTNSIFIIQRVTPSNPRRIEISTSQSSLVGGYIDAPVATRV